MGLTVYIPLVIDGSNRCCLSRTFSRGYHYGDREKLSELYRFYSANAMLKVFALGIGMAFNHFMWVAVESIEFETIMSPETVFQTEKEYSHPTGYDLAKTYDISLV